MMTGVANVGVEPRHQRVGTKTTSRRRLALTFLALGVSLLVFHNTVTDYVYGLVAPDGIYIPNATHKFSKEEAKGGVFTHTFRIYNLRPRRLVAQAEPDCGCTGVSWQSATIAPFSWKECFVPVRSGCC